MSRRPTDWSALAGSDPVPGDPDEIERVARSLTDMAEEITRQAANLRTLSTADGWDADAGRTFADSARDLAGQLDQAQGRYATAGGALKGYAPELRHAQSAADAALTDAKAAQRAINANQPPDHPPAAPTPDQATAERHRQNAYDGGIDALQAAQRKLANAIHHRDEHAGRAERAIRDSIDHDGLKDSWWDKVTNWVSEHADLLRAISEIARIVATVLSTIALIISFIPVLNFLTPVLLGLAALASLVSLAANLMLALAGEGSWLDVAVDLFAVVTFGYGAKASMAARQAQNLRYAADPVDVELAWVLLLVLSRTHLSSYRVGRWFGPLWASTPDQRLTIGNAGVYYVAEDGMLLVYPTPVGEIPVLPEEGPRWPLSRTEDGGCTITDPERGQTLHFAGPGTGTRFPVGWSGRRLHHRSGCFTARRQRLGD